MRELFFVTREELMEALAGLPPDTVIAGSKPTLTVGEIPQLCTFPLPDGGRVPIRWIKVRHVGARGYLVDICPPDPPAWDEWIGFVVEPGSPAYPPLQELQRRDEESERASLRRWAELRTSEGWFKLKDGQFVTLQKLVVSHTYSGCLEGDPRIFSAGILEDVARQASDLIQCGGPVVVLPPEYIPLPDFLWVGHFERSEESSRDGPMVSTELCIAWFVTALGKPLDEVIQSAVARVDWDVHARRYEWEP